MNLSKKQLAFLNTVRGWTESDVIHYLKNNNLNEYICFAEAKSLDGYKLLSLSEGIIAMWRPKIDHKKIMTAIQDLIRNPEKHVENRNKASVKDTNYKPKVPDRSHLPNLLNKNKKSDSSQLESIDKEINPPKSFLYRNKNNAKGTNNCINAYVPMNGNANCEVETESKIKQDLYLTLCQDRGYYEMSNKSAERTNLAIPEEDNPYEELNFSSKKKMGILKRMLKPPINKPKPNLEDIKNCKKKPPKKAHQSRKTISNRSFNKSDLEDDFSHSTTDLTGYKKINDDSNEEIVMVVCPEYSVIDENENSVGKNAKIEHFDDVTSRPSQSKTSNLTRLDEKEALPDKLVNKMNCSGRNDVDDFPDEHFYETPEMREDLLAVFEDIVVHNIVVENYLEPRKFYRAQSGEAIMDSLADEMIKLFDANFSDTKIETQSSKSETDKDTHEAESMLATKPAEEGPIRFQPLSVQDEDLKPLDAVRRWNESFGRGGKLNNTLPKKQQSNVVNMAERPLPVPVENEFYYMEIARAEAEALLEGQPDGTFILRPSSQSNHAYTVTLMYQGRIYNIGCRRRLDGRLALGFSKATEPNFLTINELIEYYYNEKLVLLVDGKKVGSTVLKRLHP